MIQYSVLFVVKIVVRLLLELLSNPSSRRLHPAASRTLGIEFGYRTPVPLGLVPLMGVASDGDCGVSSRSRGLSVVSIVVCCFATLTDTRDCTKCVVASLLDRMQTFWHTTERPTRCNPSSLVAALGAVFVPWFWRAYSIVALLIFRAASVSPLPGPVGSGWPLFLAFLCWFRRQLKLFFVGADSQFLETIAKRGFLVNCIHHFAV